MPEGDGRPWRGVALLVAGAFFMENLDGTIISTAAPRMAESFGVRSVAINVVITVYLLTLAVFIPVSGWIADRFGARTVFAGAIAGFTLTSGLCAVSTSLAELTVMRVLQGVAGALMVPVGRLVVLRRTTPAELIDAFAYLTWPALVAPVVAPALGGALSTYATWRWIFVINLPLGVAALLVTLRIVPNTRELSPAALDWRGFVLTGLGLGALVNGLELATNTTINGPEVAGWLAVGVISLVAAIRHVGRARFPLLRLDAMTIATFRVAVLGGSFFRLAVAAVPFLLPLMFQNAFGWSPLKAGLLVAAIFIGNIGIKPFTTPLLRQFGFRWLLVTSGVGFLLTVICCGFLTAHTPLGVSAFVLFASGVFRSAGFTAYNVITFADVEAADVGNANTLMVTIQQLTIGLGVAAGALALRAAGPVERLLDLRGTGTRSFTIAFWILATSALLAIVDSLRLPRDAGAAITARRT